MDARRNLVLVGFMGTGKSALGRRVAARVVAPVPWFPSSAKAFGRYGQFARVPAWETRFGIEVVHPRYPVLPKIGMSAAPLFLYAAVKPVLARLIRAPLSSHVSVASCAIRWAISHFAVWATL